MQTTSEIWKSLWAADGTRAECRAVIGEAAYDAVSSPVVCRALMQDGPSIGNAASANCRFALRTPAEIPRSAEVRLQVRLTDGETASEWLAVGTFFISRRRRDPATGVLALECYDALLKANAVWTPSEGGWPRPMAAVASELAALLGVEPDPDTTLRAGAAYVIDRPDPGATIRDALARIAAANGGNWFLTPDNRLRLAPFAAGAADDPNAVRVRAVVGDMADVVAARVTGVRYAEDDAPVLLGDDTGVVLDADVGAAIAADLYQDLAGVAWQSYELEGAVYDPAAELGDPLFYGEDVAGTLCVETVALGPAIRGTVSAPESGELSGEYPFIGGGAKALRAARLYAAQLVDGLDGELTQAEIFNRLTGNGAAQGLYMADGQLYVNASYIRSGTLALGGLNDANGLLQILDANGNLVAQGDNRGLIINNGRIVLQIPSVHTGGNDLHINDEWNTAGVKYALRNVANLGNGQYSTVLIDRGVLSVIDGNNESVRLKTTNLTPGNVSVNAVGAMDTAALALDGYGVSSTDPDVIEWSRMGMRLSNEQVRFYLGNGSSAAQTWFALSLGQLSYRGDVLLTKPLPVSSGGTGASTASAARASLGAVGSYAADQSIALQHTNDGKLAVYVNGARVGTINYDAP